MKIFSVAAAMSALDQASRNYLQLLQAAQYDSVTLTTE
jgi:hypothetical protein